MGCPICIDLKRSFTARLNEYREARASACYRVTTEFAAQKNVDMERARYELEEHHHVCVSIVRAIAPLLEQQPAALQLRQFAVCEPQIAFSAVVILPSRRLSAGLEHGELELLCDQALV